VVVLPLSKKVAYIVQPAGVNVDKEKQNECR